MNDSAGPLQDEINKRLTLNLLIQGSAQHAFLTSHYLVRDELTAIHPDLLFRYDQFAVAGFVQYWCGESILINGWPDRFWRRTLHPKHPFSRHPLLASHGLGLALAAKKRAYERSRAKKVSRNTVLFSFQLVKLLVQIGHMEAKHKAGLVHLAKCATQQVWAVPYERMDAQLTNSVAFGRPRPPTTLRASLLRKGAAGYGGVRKRNSEFRVVGKGWLWPILSHELVKGTVELICMHGLNQLKTATYRTVLKEADRIEYEPWMLQAGSELWRQLLPLLPDDRHVSEMIMHIARLPAHSLERLMFAVIEDKESAREWLAVLGSDQNEPT